MYVTLPSCSRFLFLFIPLFRFYLCSEKFVFSRPLIIRKAPGFDRIMVLFTVNGECIRRQLISQNLSSGEPGRLSHCCPLSPTATLPQVGVMSPSKSMNKKFTHSASGCIAMLSRCHKVAGAGYIMHPPTEPCRVIPSHPFPTSQPPTQQMTEFLSSTMNIPHRNMNVMLNASRPSFFPIATLSLN